MFNAMNGGWSNGRLFIGLSDSKIECGEAFIFTRHINTRFQLGMVNRKTLDYFHKGYFLNIVNRLLNILKSHGVVTQGVRLLVLKYGFEDGLNAFDLFAMCELEHLLQFFAADGNVCIAVLDVDATYLVGS